MNLNGKSRVVTFSGIAGVWKRLRFLLPAVVSGMVMFCAPTLRAKTPTGFYALGSTTWVSDISADGSTVTGTHAGLFTWTAAGGLTNIGMLPGSSTTPGSAYLYVNGISGTGGTVIGYGGTSAAAAQQAWMWSATNQFTTLPAAAGSPTYQQATAISDDGTVIGGINGNSGQLFSMVLWNAAGVVTGTVPSLSNNSQISPSAFSTNGSVAVGRDPGSGAFRWTSATGLVSLGAWDANRVSSDGSVVVGTTTGTSGSQAYYWTAATGIKTLPYLNPGDTYAEATDVSADGTTVVGNSGTGIFIWDATDGMRDLQQLMTLNGLNTTHFTTLGPLVRMSSNGQSFAGNGVSSLGNEGWVATGVASQTYSAWQAAQFTPAQQSNPAISGPAADPGNDGITNLMAFALGLEPGAPDAVTGLPYVTQESGNMVFRYTAPTLITGVAFTVQSSPDLINWTNVNSIPVVESRTPSIRTMEVTIPASGTKMFFRLQVTLP